MMKRNNEKQERIFRAYPFLRNAATNIVERDEKGNKLPDRSKGFLRTCILTHEQEQILSESTGTPYFYILVENDEAIIKELKDTDVSAIADAAAQKKAIEDAVEKARIAKDEELKATVATLTTEKDNELAELRRQLESANEATEAAKALIPKKKVIKKKA